MGRSGGPSPNVLALQSTQHQLDKMPAVRNYINKSKEDILQFLKKASADRYSPEYAELFNNLLKMFVDCDLNKNGLVSKAQFSDLVDTAAETPRRYGFAPSSADMFKNKAEETASRMELFGSMDNDDNGTITFDEFLGYTMTHIACKAAPLEAHPKIETTKKSEYIANMELALKKGNDAYVDLYWFLLNVFLDKCGSDFCADITQFTVMVDKATTPARRLGIFAATLKPEVMQKVYKKIILFDTMNFNEFLGYMVDHVFKTNSL